MKQWSAVSTKPRNTRPADRRVTPKILLSTFVIPPCKTYIVQIVFVSAIIKSDTGWTHEKDSFIHNCSRTCRFNHAWFMSECKAGFTSGNGNHRLAGAARKDYGNDICNSWAGGGFSQSEIATALNIEVYQLFIPQDKKTLIIEETPENERIRAQLTEEIVEQIRLSVNKSLDKVKNNK